MQWVPFGRLVRWRSARLTCVLGALGALGCGHAGSAEAGHPSTPSTGSLERMRADIASLQAERERMAERLSILEMAEQRRVQAEQKVPRATVGLRELSPRLPVVRIGENGQESVRSPAAQVDEDEPQQAAPGLGNEGDRRPMIEARGAVGSLRARRASTREEPTTLETSAANPEARRAFDAALLLLRQKKYDVALQAWTSFLVRYPDHPATDAAMYWRGECLMAQSETARAAEQFEGILARFPFGTKAPDALLKLGLCQRRLGASAVADRTFADLKERYPNSDAARQVPR